MSVGVVDGAKARPLIENPHNNEAATDSVQHQASEASSTSFQVHAVLRSLSWARRRHYHRRRMSRPLLHDMSLDWPQAKPEGSSSSAMGSAEAHRAGSRHGND